MAFTPNERHTLSLCAVGHFSAHFSMLVYPTAAVMVAKEFELPLSTVLGWSFLGYLLYGLGALPVGFLTDHVRARWVVRVGVLGTGLAMMAVPLAAPGKPLAIALGCVGLFASLYHPAGLGLISRTVAARGRALGINGVFGNIGIAGAPLAAELATTAWGWRTAYFVIGGGLFLLALAVVWLPIEEPTPGILTRDEHHKDGSQRTRLFLILLVAMMLGGLSYRANSITQPAFYEQRVAIVGYGVATSIVYLAGTVGQYIGGKLADQYDLRILYVAFHALSLPFVLAMTVLAGLPLLAAASLFLFFSLGMQPIENSLVARFTPDRWRSTAYGLKFSMVFGIGALSVEGVHLIIATHDLVWVFVGIAAIVAMLTLVAGLIAWLTRDQPIYNAEGLGASTI